MRQTREIPTLMFHGIHSHYLPENQYSEADRFYAIRDGRFVEILGRITDSGWTATTFASPPESARPNGHVVCLTFDDAYLSHYVSALPILTDFNLSAIFFVTVGEVGRRGRLSWPQVRTLADSGMSLQSHTVSHRPLDRLSVAEVRRELSDSKAILEDATGRAVTLLSLPGGRGGRRVARLAREVGYERVFGSRIGYGWSHRRSGEAEIVHRSAVKARDSLQTWLDYLRPTAVSRARERMSALAATAAKDLLGDAIYDYLKTYPIRRARSLATSDRT